MLNIASNQASAEVPINENFNVLEHVATYGKKASTTTGLVWGYWGGTWGGNVIADGTLTLTASAVNYIVVDRTTGAISVSTATTNWNSAATYARVYQITTGTLTVTSFVDYRAGLGGVHGPNNAVLAFYELANVQTGTTYTIQASDTSKLVTLSNAAAIAVTLPNATGFGTGFWFDIANRGAGTVTITPATSTIDGVGSLALSTGQGVHVVSDGTNYFTVRGLPAAGSGATLAAVNVFTKNQTVSPSALTSGATVSVDASLSNNFKLTLATNATLANPTNATDGMVLNIRVKQDATGSRTLAYGSAYKWPGGAAPVLSTAANAVDMISMYYDSTDAVWACVINKAFA